MSVSHSWFGASAVKSRWTRSSWTGGPGPCRSCRASSCRTRSTSRCPSRSATPSGSPSTAAGVAGLVGEEPVAELRVVAVGVEQRVGPVGRLELGVGDRAGQPAVVGLAGELEHPARHRDGDPVAGAARGRAGTSFSRQVRLRQIRRRPAQDLVLLLQQPDPLLRAHAARRSPPRSCPGLTPVLDIGGCAASCADTTRRSRSRQRSA